MTKISEKYCRGNQNTHFVFNNFFFFGRKSCRFEIMWKNIVEWSRPQTTTWRMPIACWIPKATNTHPKYVIIIAPPLQQRLHERASMLRYTYIGCIVNKMYKRVQSNTTLQVFSPTQHYRCSVQHNLTGVQANTTLQEFRPTQAYKVFSPTQHYTCSVQHNLTGVQSNTLQVFSPTQPYKVFSPTQHYRCSVQHSLTGVQPNTTWTPVYSLLTTEHNQLPRLTTIPSAY
jgi:hypothetical protein